MGRGDHLKRYHFQPGQSGNPSGRPASSTSEKEVRRFTREHVAEVYNKIIDMTKKELDELIADEESTEFEKGVARAVIAMGSSGTPGSLENVLERIIGKVPVKSEMEFTGPGGAPIAPATIILQPVKSVAQAPPEAQTPEGEAPVAS